jgi:hypothetical protein
MTGNAEIRAWTHGVPAPHPTVCVTLPGQPLTGCGSSCSGAACPYLLMTARPGQQMHKFGP